MKSMFVRIGDDSGSVGPKKTPGPTTNMCPDEAGRLRLEGKDYVVQEADVMHFRFNV